MKLCSTVPPPIPSVRCGALPSTTGGLTDFESGSLCHFSDEPRIAGSGGDSSGDRPPPALTALSEGTTNQSHPTLVTASCVPDLPKPLRMQHNCSRTFPALARVRGLALRNHVLFQAGSHVKGEQQVSEEGERAPDSHLRASGRCFPASGPVSRLREADLDLSTASESPRARRAAHTPRTYLYR